MLDACSQHADSGWIVSEESLHLINVMDKNVDDIGIPKPSWWVHIPSEYRIPIPPVCDHFRASLRRDPEDPLWAIAFADHIVMIAVTVVYQALVRQRFIFLEPSVRAMVRSIPPIWLVKGSSVDEGDVGSCGISSIPMRGTLVRSAVLVGSRNAIL